MPRISSTDGVELSVHDFGGDGPPLLLCHATGFHARVWLPLVAHLTEAVHCWGIDLRAHGDSTAPATGDFHWRGFGQDVLATVDTLGFSRPFGAGHSKGAAALLLAEIDRPGTFRALYGYEPVVVPFTNAPPPTDENPLSVGARRRRPDFPSRDHAYANYAAKPPFSTLHPDALRAYVEHGFADQGDGTVRLKCDPEYEARTYAMGSSHGAFDHFGEIQCPVTVACGADSDAFGPSLIELQAAALPHGRAEVLAGLGHFGPLEDPARVAASMRAAFAGT